MHILYYKRIKQSKQKSSKILL